MLHPSYTDLMAVVNSEVEPGEHPVVQSRYSIVLATAKRAREIIAGQEPLVNTASNKPLYIHAHQTWLPLYRKTIPVLQLFWNHYKSLLSQYLHLRSD